MKFSIFNSEKNNSIQVKHLVPYYFKLISWKVLTAGYQSL